MNAQIQSLQDQVNNLYSSLNALHNRQDGHESKAYGNSRVMANRIRDLANQAFNFGIANNSLEMMVASPEYRADDDTHNGLVLDPSLRAQEPQCPNSMLDDPMWLLKKDDALRLCKVYEDEVCSIYPILDAEAMIKRADSLLTFMESATRTGLVKSLSMEDSFMDEENNILRMVIATALAIDGNGDSELGRRLFESVKTKSGLRLWKPVGLQGLTILVIMVSFTGRFYLALYPSPCRIYTNLAKAQYHFHVDEEAQASRIIGLAARMSCEMGLHRRDSLTKLFNTTDELARAIRLFWSIYVLDRRWSMGTNMPFAIQDSDIDPTLPEPVREYLGIPKRTRCL